MNEATLEAATNNPNRIGNFTSSEIWKLTTKGKNKDELGAPALTYIKEKNIERKMGRSLTLKKDSRSTLWGTFVEHRVHELLPLGYESVGKITLNHPTIPTWAGSPDNLNRAEEVVGDTKCPEPHSFAFLIESLEQGAEAFKKDYKEYYWQLISNAVITNSKFIELIAYCPYESELEAIREMAQDYNLSDFYKYRFIVECHKSELPYLPNEGYYTNLNIFRFPVPEQDKDFLTSCVLKASELLIEPFKK